MSDFEPTQPYIYQPGRPFNPDGTENKVIYALAGPYTGRFSNKRFTREEAEKELQKILEELSK